MFKTSDSAPEFVARNDRMVVSKFDRALRARDDSDSEPYSDEVNVSSPSVLDTAEGQEPHSEEDDEDEAGDTGEDDNEDSEEDGPQADDEAVDYKAQLGKISFGALAAAQDSLESSRKRKRGTEDNGGREAKLQALRERLREIAEGKNSNGKLKNNPKAGKIAAVKQATNAGDGLSESDSGSESDSEDGGSKRRSKHAPAAMSSRKAVSRKREVVPVPKKHVRDPRFDPLSGPVSDEKLKKNYAFLNDYRASEMVALKDQIAKTKNTDEKERLKKQLLSMESREKARLGKEKRQEIVREHRKKEKEAVAKGKKPFFLKSSEVKKAALVNQFENMKGKQRDRAIERRRKKVAAKERKNMPFARRTAED